MPQTFNLFFALLSWFFFFASCSSFWSTEAEKKPGLGLSAFPRGAAATLNHGPSGQWEGIFRFYFPLPVEEGESGSGEKQLFEIIF